MHRLARQSSESGPKSRWRYARRQECKNEGKLMVINAQRPNPSIEGTCNIWLRQLSPAPHVKR